MIYSPTDENTFPKAEAECIQIQKGLAGKINLTDVNPPENIKIIAGVDIAYWKEISNGKSFERGVCCIVVIDRSTKAVLEEVYADGEIKFPYIHGCLAFRELPLVLKAAAKLTHSPDLFVFDGNGVLHPRKAGLAAHAAVYLGAPTFGVAKTYFKVNGVNFTMPEELAGSFTDIEVNGEVLGRALRTRTAVKPVFVSAGNGISLQTACSLAMELTTKESRVPVPTRLADLATHKWREQLQNR